MEDLFTKTSVNLTPEYINLFSSYQLASKLSKVKKLTGVKTSKAKNKYTLLGSWDQVNNAFELLQKWHDNPSDEPVEKDRIIEILEHTTPISQNSNVLPKTSNEHNLIRQTESRKTCDDLNDIEDDTEDTVADDADESSIYCEQNVEAKHGSIKLSVDNIENVKKDSFQLITIKSNDVSITSEANHTGTESIPFAGKPEVTGKSKERTFQKNALSEVKRSQIHTIKNEYVTDSQPQTHHIVNLNGHSSTETQPIDDSVDIVLYDDANNDSSKENDIKADINANQYQEENSKEETKTGKRNTRKPGDIGYWSRVKIDNYNEKHKCPKCEVVLKSRKRYMEHMRRIHIKDYKCDTCERRFGYPTDLHRHKCPGIPDPNNLNKRKGGRPKKEKVPVFIPCPECDYIGTSKKRFNGHIRRAHRLQFSCDQCEKRFGFARDLQRHKNNVHVEVSHFCEKCSKSYKSKVVFDEHMKTHEEGYVKPKFCCQVCEKSFTTKYALATHIKTEHLGVKRTYLCQICGKKFSQRNSYKQHSNAHAGIKPYKCDICSAAFTYHKSLKEHKFMHDTIRRFQCQLCDKAFRQKTTLQIHMKVHKAIKDHICKTCGKGFAQKQALERHERIHTGIKPYTCIPCQRTFGDASTIRRHMLTIHQKDETNWKEDTLCTVKKKTDYYVLGGSGQNRIYKRTAKKQNNQAPKTSVKSKHQEMQTSEQPIFLVNTQEHANEYSLSDLSTLQDQTGQFHTLQPGAIFTVSTSLAQSLQNINTPLAFNCNTGNNNNTLTTPILDYSTLSQTLQSQLLVEKKTDNFGSQYELPVSDNQIQQNTLAQTSGLQQMTETQTSNEDNTGSLGQNINNLWGFVGYQSYYNTASATGQYNTQQN